MCADCGQRDPSWASINLGVFVCLDCSGIHRNLGVHISQVRSLSLDTWKIEWVKVMQSMGNTRANAYWEGNMAPSVSRPPATAGHMEVRKAFIRQKYEQKMWFLADPQFAEVVEPAQVSAQARAPRARAARAPTRLPFQRVAAAQSEANTGSGIIFRHGHGTKSPPGKQP